MDVINNGRVITTTGWYCDLHGHQALLRAGELAPPCPHSVGPALWRLMDAPAPELAGFANASAATAA